MSNDTRRRVVLFLVALIVTAMVLSLVACTTTEGDGPDSALDTETYPMEMERICTATSTELEAIPAPPEQISLVDWAGEIARVLGNEADRFDDLRVADELREPHGSLVRTAREQADQFALLGATLDESGGGAAGIGAINDEIRSLSLGREELATTLDAVGCGTRELT